MEIISTTPPTTTTPLTTPHQSPVATRTRDIERYIKFFLIKSIQVIVQSRIVKGKVKTECRLPGSGDVSNGDWFNLPLTDDPQILSKTHPHLFSETITIEISLITEDFKLLLEIWRIENKSGDGSIATKDVYNVYNRLGLLIKSLICVTRVTPAYKVARSGTVGIGWEINGEVDGCQGDFVGRLGEKFREVVVGKVPINSASSITASLFYRTELMDTKSTANSLLIKSDHYGDENVVKRSVVKPAFHEVIFREEEEEEEAEVKFVEVIDKVQEKEPPKVPPQTHEKIQKQFSLPFAAQHSTHNSSNSSNSETELMSVIEEFRVAPSNLNFAEHNEDVAMDLNNFEQELNVYDKMLEKLVIE